MKYKCLVCGQITDNNEMCPFCGSDSSQMVPIDSEGKTGHFRCLVCGRETENGNYCPYCGSQRLYNLDSRKVENTTSINIQNGDGNAQNPQVNKSEQYEHVHYENKNSFLFNRPDEATMSHEIIHEEESNNQEEFGAPKLQNEEEYHEPENSEYEDESLETKYFNMFGEMLQLDSIQNPDPEKVETLYKIGINRGSKITPEEIAATFMEEPSKETTEYENFNESGHEGENQYDGEHIEENVAPAQENFIREPEEVNNETEENPNVEENNGNYSVEENEIDNEMTNHQEEENNLSPAELEKELYTSVCLLLAKKQDDEISNQLLNLLRNKVLNYIQQNIDIDDEENKILAILDALIAKGNETNNEELIGYKKFLDLLRVLFNK